MTLNCIPKALSKGFYVYGKFVARHPLLFIISPLIIAIGLAAGLIRIESTSDPEYLYVPVNAPSKDERKFFQRAFPHNDSQYFSPLRLTELDGTLRIHIQNKHGSNVLNDDVIGAIFNLDDYVMNFKAKYKGNHYQYEDLCAKWEGVCTYNALRMVISNRSIDDVTLIYPLTFVNGQSFNFIQELGSVDVNSNGVVQSAKSVLLTYHVRYQDTTDIKKSMVWLNSLRDDLFKYKDSKIDVDFETSLSLEQELENSVSTILPLFTMSYTILSIFAVLSCMMLDWVRSKPWVAMSGLVAAGLGAVSSMGLLSVTGVKFASVVGSMPFLVIGIGLDDMFILVSAWRYTSFKLPTEERVGQMLQSAAVSITITSVTDALAFGIGCLTPFRSVTIFCAYAGVAVVFVYIYMITFTTACMAYSGRREESNRHCLVCKKVVPKSQAENKSRRYQIFCASGNYEGEKHVSGDISTLEQKQYPPQTDGNEGDETSENQLSQNGIHLPFLNVFLGTTYANLIMQVHIKILVVFVYACMIGGAIYGIIVMEEGLDRANLAPDDSYFRDFFRKYQRDYSEIYGPVVMVAIDEPLDYTDETVRDDIRDLITEFRNDKYFVKEKTFVISWLESYLGYLNLTGQAITNMNITQFITVLQDQFFQIGAFTFHQADVAISRDNTYIRHSRFFVQTKSLGDSTSEKNMMLHAREIAEKSKFKVIVFSPPFIFFDQFTVILQNTLQNLGIAVASMMVVSLILIPNFITAVCVTLATISICCCIMGYMSLWGVCMDSVSMINLVMCIGFSVDFAAHISYHFVVSTSLDPKQRAQDALGYLGTPIIQGALSTIIAVSALAASDTYIFRTFFKLVVLVMLFGVYHAMCLLPVLLSSLNCDRQREKSGNRDVPGKGQSKIHNHLDGIENQSFDVI